MERAMRPAWWLLYAIGAATVGALVLARRAVPSGVALDIVRVVILGGGWGAIALWLRANAGPLARFHAEAAGAADEIQDAAGHDDVLGRSIRDENADSPGDRHAGTDDGADRPGLSPGGDRAGSGRLPTSG